MCSMTHMKHDTCAASHMCNMSVRAELCRHANISDSGCGQVAQPYQLVFNAPTPQPYNMTCAFPLPPSPPFEPPSPPSPFGACATSCTCNIIHLNRRAARCGEDHLFRRGSWGKDHVFRRGSWGKGHVFRRGSWGKGRVFRRGGWGKGSIAQL